MMHQQITPDLREIRGTQEGGLEEEEAKARFLQFGPNEIEAAKRKSLLVKFLQQFTHFLAILLWIAALLSFVSESMHPGEGMLNLGMAIVGVILINAVFTFVQEYKAERSVEALRELLPFEVKVVRGGDERVVLAREIVPGDWILLTEGDKIPADARVVRSSRLMVNNAPLTGESLPVLLEPDKEENIAYAGTTVLSGSGQAIVLSTGMQTEFGRIAKLASAVESELSPLQKEVVRATRTIAFLAVSMGILFFLIGQFTGKPFWGNFLFAVGIIVANVPEGLLPTLTLSLAIASQRMAKKNALVKALASVETLGSVSVICTDKTGTLTQNKMVVKSLWFDGTFHDWNSIAPSPENMLLRIAYCCNNGRLIHGHYRGDSTEVALLKAARERLGDLQTERIAEIPFDPERKRMTTIHIVGEETFAFTKGAPEAVLPLCGHALLQGKETPLQPDLREKIREASRRAMEEGLRVLSFAYKKMETPLLSDSPDAIENGMVFVGLIGIEDPPRLEVPAAIRKCHHAGIKVIMITGDGAGTALAVAKEIGLTANDPVLLEGHCTDGMTDTELMNQLGQKDIVFARMTPKHKMRVVSLLKESGRRVAVTGDGVNDAPALKKADIGIAMGITGTDVAKEASDMVLLDDNFATIVNAIEEGRTVYDNIRKFIVYIFSSNIPEVVPYLSYVLLRIPLPLTILQILAVDLGTDMVPALALGAERPTEEVMKRPPRDPKERLLNWKLLSHSYLFLGPIEAAAGLFGFFYVLYSGGWRWGQELTVTDVLYLKATTACLTAIIVTQIANVFACRSFHQSIFRIGIFSNKLVLIGICCELLLQFFIVYHPAGNHIFATHPIPWLVWSMLIPFAVLLLAAEEIRKWLAARTISGSGALE